MRAAPLVLVVVAGCSVPLIHATLEPVPAAGAASAPVKAQVRRVGITHGLSVGGAKLDRHSCIAVEIDVFNADSRRPISVEVLRLVVRDALGGDDIVGQTVSWGDGGLPSALAASNDDGQPPRFVRRADEARSAYWGAVLGAGSAQDPRQAPRFVLRPSETRTVWVAYAKFPVDALERTAHATIHLDAEGQRLEIPIADPVPGGPHWKLAQHVFAVYLGGALSSLDVGARASSTDKVLSPLGMDMLGSRGRLAFGVSARFEYLFREALLASGPPALGASWLATAGWVPWRFPVGLYAEAGAFFGSELPPQGYARADGSTADALVIPRVGAGLWLPLGPRLSSTGPFPIEAPLSPLRRFMVRVGYAQWFNLGDAAGVGGFQMSLAAAILP